MGGKIVCVSLTGRYQWGRGTGNNKSKVYSGVFQATKLHKVERSEKDNLHGFCFLEGIASELSLQYKAIQK